MKWRPITFHQTFIPKVMDGTKTQTRRLVNLERLRIHLPREIRSDLWDATPARERRVVKPGRYHALLHQQGAVSVAKPKFGVKPGEFHFVCPLADGETSLVQRDSGTKVWTIHPAPDQRLWVRERFWIGHDSDGAEGQVWDCGVNLKEDTTAPLQYVATPNNPDRPDEPGEWVGPDEVFPERTWVRWGAGHPLFYSSRPSIHMPRWASRTSLEVRMVRLQRLMDISEEDAQSEGIKGPHLGRWTDARGKMDPPMDEPPRPWAHSFFVAWKAIHNVDTAAILANPWVWAYTFRRIEVN